mmetsp:Transcript_29753/g.55807  ORF Transcript_29753/g.55807 Transcript_29753/m.55807 type:complete len:256 (+) Transcript_29753:1792-2559(+)
MSIAEDDNCFSRPLSCSVSFTLPAKLPFGDTPPQSLTVSVGVSLTSLFTDRSSAKSPFPSQGGEVQVGDDGLGFCFRVSFGPISGVGRGSPPPLTPRTMSRLRPQVTKARTIESVRNLAPVLCGGIFPKDRSTSRLITWCHFPSSPCLVLSRKSSHPLNLLRWFAVSHFCSAIHNQKAGRRLISMPPVLTAFCISTCSFSATTLRQNRFTIFIRHTATGSPRKDNTIATILGTSHTLASNGLGWLSGTMKRRLLS